MPDFKWYKPQEFSPEDLDSLLDGTPLLKDLERYQLAVDQFISHQHQERRLADKINDDLKANLRGIDLYTLLSAPDSDASYARYKGILQETRAQVENLNTGGKAAKRERRADSLAEIFTSLSARVKSYKESLPTQKAFHLLLSDD